MYGSYLESRARRRDENDARVAPVQHAIGETRGGRDLALAQEVLNTVACARQV